MPSFPVPSDFTQVVFAGATPLDVVASLLNQGLIDGAKLNDRLESSRSLSPSYFANWLETSAPVVPSGALDSDTVLPVFPASPAEAWPELSAAQYLNIKSDAIAAALMAGGANPFLAYENLNRRLRLPIDRMVELGLASAVAAALRRPDAVMDTLKSRTAQVGRGPVEMEVPYVHAAITKDAHLLLQALLTAGFSATQPDGHTGATPLHGAWRARFAVTPMLLSAGASWSTQDNAGKTVLEVWVANLPADKRLDVLTQVAALPMPPAAALWQKALVAAVGKADMEVVTRFWQHAHPSPVVKDPGYWHAVALHAMHDASAAVKSVRTLSKRKMVCPRSDAAWLWWTAHASNTQTLKLVAAWLVEGVPVEERLASLFPVTGLQAAASVWDNTVQRDMLWVPMLNSVWQRRPEVPRAMEWSGEPKKYWRHHDEAGHTPLSCALESLACVPGVVSTTSQVRWDSLPEALRAQPCLIDGHGIQKPDHHLASAMLRLLINQTSPSSKNPVSTAQPWAYWCDPSMPAWPGLDPYSLSHQIVLSLAYLVTHGARTTLPESQWAALEERCANDPFLAKFWPGLRELHLEQSLTPAAPKGGKSPRF